MHEPELTKSKEHSSLSPELTLLIFWQFQFHQHFQLFTKNHTTKKKKILEHLTESYNASANIYINLTYVTKN